MTTASGQCPICFFADEWQTPVACPWCNIDSAKWAALGDWIVRRARDLADDPAARGWWIVRWMWLSADQSSDPNARERFFRHLRQAASVRNTVPAVAAKTVLDRVLRARPLVSAVREAALGSPAVGSGI